MYRRLLPLLFVLPSLGIAAPDPASLRAGFLDELVQQEGFERAPLEQTLHAYQVRQSILDAIARPAEKRLTWARYRNIFLQPARIDGGVKFWNENQQALQQAEARYGVPPQIITAIIGVETLYGQRTGNYRVLDALATLAFHYPPRAKFFRSELKHFLILSRDEKMDPLTPEGSYAGAMGRPQFMPSSYRAYAVDFDGDGFRDIWNNNADVIGSVANYFKRHGWQAGGPVTLRVEGVGKQHRKTIDAGMKPSVTVGELLKSGIRPAGSAHLPPLDAKASLIELEGESGKEYWLGLDNFYSITRYNHSNLYAMAVYQLAQAIEQARRQQTQAHAAN